MMTQSSLLPGLPQLLLFGWMIPALPLQAVRTASSGLLRTRTTSSGFCHFCFPAVMRSFAKSYPRFVIVSAWSFNIDNRPQRAIL